MTDQATETPAADQEPERIESISSLAEKVDRLMELVTGAARAEPAEADAGSVKAEVQAELKRLREAEDRKAARDREKADSDARLAAVEEKVKEKPPREYRRIENWHRWRTEDEK